jgi:hypothetical protein
MFTEAQEGKTTNGKGVRGRKDSSGIAKAPTKIPEKKLKDGEHLALKAAEARETFNDHCTAVGNAHGVQASVVSKVIKARIAENYDDKKREIEQLAFAFGIVDSVSVPAEAEDDAEAE